jgi:late competence protein required for DNA uptake (superfamily II DNA/RNA helicase)
MSTLPTAPADWMKFCMEKDSILRFFPPLKELKTDPVVVYHNNGLIDTRLQPENRWERFMRKETRKIPCSECGEPLYYFPGYPQTYWEPEEREAIYCVNCGVYYRLLTEEEYLELHKRST